MPEVKPIYRYSLKDAVEHNERDEWRESYRENCSCARAIEESIRANFDGMYLNENCVKGVIGRFGFDRVNWVLANTIQYKYDDGRFSHGNRDWAKNFWIPDEENRWQFVVESHPAVLDGFVNLARKVWKELGLFDKTSCISEKDGEIDYKNKIVAISPTVLKDRYKTPDDQLFLATGGFGCSPNARGRKVYGTFLKDGEETYYERADILGVLKNDCVPEWAKEKAETLLTSKTTDLEDCTAEKEENTGITMGGMK
jgi:hypothetical protein